MLLARELGAVEVSFDGVRLVMGAAPVKAHTVVDPDVQLPIMAENAVAVADRAAEDAHYAKWKRITRSSGAPIPAYVKP